MAHPRVAASTAGSHLVGPAADPDADPDADPGVDQLVDRLAAGAVDWLTARLDHFDPFSWRAGEATHAPAKAALELGLLCHCAARLGVAQDALAPAHDLVGRLWRNPGFPRLIGAQPEFASSYALIYAALAPPGADDGCRRAALAGLAPDFLTPEGKTAFQRVEIRYYADRAGVRHGIEPLADLVPASPLVAPRVSGLPGGPPLTTGESYRLTHTAFYLGDFGHADPGLGAEEASRARELVEVMLRHCVAHDLWDLAAELVLTQFVLGVDPPVTAAGAAALECLARARRPDGTIPGREPALRAMEADPPAETFRKAYHTTLVTALTTLTLSAGRPR